MKGEVVYLYAFAVANEIATTKITTILSKKPYPYEIKVPRNYPRYVPLYKPLAIELSPLEERLHGQEVRPLIRVYDVGVITVTMRAAIETDDLQNLRPFHEPRLANSQLLDKVANDLCIQVRNDLKDLLIHSSAPTEPEAYTVFCLTDLGAVRDVNNWLADDPRQVAGLLADTEPAALSETQVAEELRLKHSFENNDLVVIDWDAALVIDLAGYVEDVLYMIELANLQLEEFRTMDQSLDGYLDKAYDHVEQHRYTLFGSPAAILRMLRRFRMDFSKLADEVRHITKFFGDWYLARVYLAARERFHLDRWRRSVEDRLAQLDQLYSVIHSEVNERRMLWLETIIVILFIIDIVPLLLGKK